MDASEVLNQAADLIEERGWKQGMGWPYPGRVSDRRLCLEGGIMAARGEDFRTVEFAEFWACPAYQAVMQYLGRDATLTVREGDLYESITAPLWDWNDTSGRTQEQVVATLRAAAVIAAARESATQPAPVAAVSGAVV